MIFRKFAPRKEGIDALRVISHHHDVLVFAGQQIDNPGLDQIGILIFIHHQVRELSANLMLEIGVVFEQIMQFDQEIIIVHEGLLLLGRGVVGLQGADFVTVRVKVGVLAIDDVFQAQVFVGGLAEYIGQGSFARKSTAAGAGEAFFDQQADQALRIHTIDDREIVGVPHLRGKPSEHFVGEGMKGAPRDLAAAVVQKPGGAPEHFIGGLAGEGQQ